jgi:hypothetical protein
MNVIMSISLINPKIKMVFRILPCNKWYFKLILLKFSIRIKHGFIQALTSDS